jgi:hypothetical protein
MLIILTPGYVLVLTICGYFPSLSFLEYLKDCLLYNLPRAAMPAKVIPCKAYKISLIVAPRALSENGGKLTKYTPRLFRIDT